MKSIAAAAVLVAPAAGKVRVVSWNAHGKKGHYGRFFRSDEVQESNIVLLQEADAAKVGAAKGQGWKSTNGGKGVVTMWDESMFTLEADTDCGNVPGSGKDSEGNLRRSGTACTIALKSKKGIVLVTNVHAGHNGKPSDVDTAGAGTARHAVKDHQGNFVTKYLQGKKIGLVIVGGDHNELGLHLTNKGTSTLMGKDPKSGDKDFHSFWKGKFYGKFGKTHHNGKIDKIFASRSGDGKALEEFGSDHKAVMVTID
jgi:hypothetical protein